MDAVEKYQVQQWLQRLGCTPVEITDASAEWHFEYDYPAQGTHRMHTLQPKGRPDMLVVATGIAVGHEHLQAFDEMAEDEQRDFGLSLRRVLNRPEVEFQMEGSDGVSKCPKLVQISRVRFADGLTLDSFAETVGFVFKAELHALWHIEQHLGSKGSSGGGGRFDFRRVSGF